MTHHTNREDTTEGKMTGETNNTAEEPIIAEENNLPDGQIEKKQRNYLWLISTGAACGGLLFGYDAVVVSGTNSQIETQFNFTPAQLGFYVSCVLWGCAVGSGFAGLISDALGRKKTLQIASVFILISAAWCGIAVTTLHLISARFIGGIGIGAAAMVCPLYISEVSPEKYRGRMVTLFQLTITIGIVMCVFANWGIFSFAKANSDSVIMGNLWNKITIRENWRAMFLAEAIPGLLFLAIALRIPESPRWLVKNNQPSEAFKVLKKLNPVSRAKSVCNEIQNAINEEGNIRIWDLFSVKLRKPLILALLICVLSEACGVSVVFYYGPQIFEDAGFGLGGSLGGFGTIAIVNLIATLFALNFVDSAGRRRLLTTGVIGAIISHLLIGILFTKEITGWPIVIAINMFVAFFACAIGPVKFIVVSEIFPNKIRGKAIALATVSIWLTSAGVAQLFPVMQSNFAAGIIFFLFAGELVLLLPVIKYLMPETKGRTIEEIERSWFKVGGAVKSNK